MVGLLLVSATCSTTQCSPSSPSVSDAGGKAFEDRRSAEAEAAAEARRAEIRTELATLGPHAWAGEYYAGDGLGVNISLTLAPRSGFVFEWHGCLGLYDRNYGAVTSQDRRLSLSFSFENERKGFAGLSPELIVVPWGSRVYLVPADDVIDPPGLVKWVTVTQVEAARAEALMVQSARDVGPQIGWRVSTRPSWRPLLAK